MSKRKYADETIKMEEETEEEYESEDGGFSDDEYQTPKPPPSFGGLISKFAFSSSSSSKTPTITLPAPIISRSTPCENPLPSSRNTRSKKFSPAEAETSLAGEPSPPSAKTKKKRAKHGGYVPPSVYAHLSPLPDTLDDNLICVFIGINPGLKTASIGHSFANPTNLFWPLLYSSGCTPDRRLPPQMDVMLPELYSLGQTNIVKRPTKDAAELSKEEMLAGVAGLEEKMRWHKPEAVCFVGKMVWEAVFKVQNRRGLRKGEFEWGWQEGVRFAKEAEKEGSWGGCRIFVVPSTSGLVAAYGPEFKRNLWKKLGDWVQMRRQERGESAPKIIEEGCPW
ncbi:DNA glycosylase [Choiromyces venosus 120613-1]|uniref:DNA glycosylase n=1 Tax=Choiromyces venosus 120613-1 TaxID=1336337 RepID=A0A3N4J625_9PEZI|nr:DNA glycosylase [Choiromyces venosus 120613-1]